MREGWTDRTTHSADLYGSLDAAQPPFFNKPYPHLSQLSSGSFFRSEGLNTIHNVIGLDETLRRCIHQLEDATFFWSDTRVSSPGAENGQQDNSVARKEKPTPAEAARVRDLLTSIQYTLVSAKYQQRSSDDPESKISEFCHIALILYSLTLLSERPPSTSVGQQIGGAFRRALSDLASESHDNARDSANTMAGATIPPPPCRLSPLGNLPRGQCYGNFPVRYKRLAARVV